MEYECNEKSKLVNIRKRFAIIYCRLIKKWLKLTRIVYKCTYIEMSNLYKKYNLVKLSVANMCKL